VIKVIMRGRPPWVLCLNMQCPSKEGRRKKAAQAKAKVRTKAAPRKKKPAPIPLAPDLPTG
jgi:hypothetical protein